MKKLIYCALALAAGLFAASCQQENLEPVQGGNTVTFTVQMPTVATKATIGNDASSINDLVYAVYRTTANDLETTLGDWDKYASLVYQKNPSETVFTDNFSTSVSLELINNQNYVILFWAQNSDVWVSGDNFDLTNITYPADSEGNMVVNRNAADKYAAFSAVRFLGANDFAGQKKVELTRPFAQINIAAADPKNYDVEVNSASMTVGAAGDMFNVAFQDAAATKNITYTWENIPATDGFTAGGVTYEHYVAMGYVFAKDNVTVSYNINTADHGTVTNADAPISNVPVAANYRTNIVGNLLTGSAQYEVVIDADFHSNNNVVKDGNSYISISTAEELLKVAEEIAKDNDDYNYIMLGGDIDLATLDTRSVASNWEPIGTKENPFEGVFDGNGYTIKNFNYVSEGSDSYVGFFGYAKNATIKNVVFENVNVMVSGDDGGDHIAAVVGVLCSSDPDSAEKNKSYVENITVQGDIYIESNIDAIGSSRVAVVVGGNDNSDIVLKNVHVIANDGSYVRANSYAGGIVGQTNRKAYFEDCTSNIDVTATRFFAGGIAGAPGNEVSFVNCHSTGDVAVTAGRAGKAHDHYRVGGIAGGWDDNIYYPLVLTNCSYTGTLSGVNLDGTVAEKFDYMGYVGRGYSVKNDSKVIIDGISFVQTAAGDYTITYGDGENFISDGLFGKENTYSVTNAEGLESINSMMANKTAGNGITINIMSDINFTGKTWTPVDSHVDFGFYISEINGNGHTISNLTINGQAMFTRFSGTGDVVVKDITFDNATVNSNGNINTAILTGHTYQNVSLENVDVKKSSITGGYKVAPLIGTVYNEKESTITATLKNCDVEDVTVTATSYDFCTTGMVAFVYADNNDKIEFENCTVKNVMLYAPNVYTAHAAIYTTGSETLFNEAEGVTVTNVNFENI